MMRSKGAFVWIIVVAAVVVIGVYRAAHTTSGDAALQFDSVDTAVLPGAGTAIEADSLQIGGSRFVPVRAVFEQLGAVVEVVGGRVTVSAGDRQAAFPVDEDAAGQAPCMALVSNGVVYAPVRSVAEQLGWQVRTADGGSTIIIDADGESRTLHLNVMQRYVADETGDRVSATGGGGGGSSLVLDCLRFANLHRDFSLLIPPMEMRLHPELSTLLHVAPDSGLTSLKLDSMRMGHITDTFSGQISNHMWEVLGPSYGCAVSSPFTEHTEFQPALAPQLVEPVGSALSTNGVRLETLGIDVTVSESTCMGTQAPLADCADAIAADTTVSSMDLSADMQMPAAGIMLESVSGSF